jgi:hypothetical protein
MRRKSYTKKGIKRKAFQVHVPLDKEMWDALEWVRHTMSRIKGDRISLGTIVRMYLEKGLQADKAFPKDPPPPQ